jgi:spermidine synthase
MGLTIIMVLIFQSFYGYVYFWIGLIITTFMVGLASGSLWANRLLKNIKTPVTQFLITEIIFVFYFGILVSGLFYIDNIQNTGFIHSILHIFVLLFTSLCGFMVGVQFPLANQLYIDEQRRFAKTAGALYASDLIGAWAGGILVTLILIPVVGMLKTGLILLLLKLCSTMIFRFARINRPT